MASPEEARRSGKQEVAGRAPACIVHAPVPTGARRKFTGGQPLGWAAQRWTSMGELGRLVASGKSGGSLSLRLFVYVFYFFL